jgi:hypothetical protein
MEYIMPYKCTTYSVYASNLYSILCILHIYKLLIVILLFKLHIKITYSGAACRRAKAY